MATAPEPAIEQDNPQECEEEELGPRKVGVNLSVTNKRAVLAMLLTFCHGGTVDDDGCPILQHGAKTKVIKKTGLAKSTVDRLWKEACEREKNGRDFLAVEETRMTNCGRKQKNYAEKLEQLKTVPQGQRSTIRSAAEAAGIAKTTLQRCYKEGRNGLEVKTSRLKPLLKPKNISNRLDYAVRQIDLDTCFVLIMLVNFEQIHQHLVLLCGTSESFTKYTKVDFVLLYFTRQYLEGDSLHKNATSFLFVS